MAKISARGATEIARCKAHRKNHDGRYSTTATYVLRSDGVILRKGQYDNGYTVWLKLPKSYSVNAAQLHKVMADNELEVV